MSMMVNSFRFAGQWSPAQIASAKLWFEGTSGLVNDGTGTPAVVSWTDQISGTVLNLGAVGGGSPLYDGGSMGGGVRPSVKHDGANNRSLDASYSYSGSVLSCFFAGQIFNAGSAYGRILSFGNTGVANDYDNAGSFDFERNNLTSTYNANRNLTTPGAASPGYNTTFIGGVKFDGSNMTHHHNGTQIGSPTASTGSFNINRLRLRWLAGSAGGADGRGYLGSIFVCESAISDSDRQKLEGYWAHRYGIAASLPGGHPYKVTPP